MAGLCVEVVTERIPLVLCKAGPAGLLWVDNLNSGPARMTCE